MEAVTAISMDVNEVDKRIQKGKLVCFGDPDPKIITLIQEKFGDILSYPVDGTSLFCNSRKALTEGSGVILFAPKSEDFFIEFGTVSQSLRKIPFIVVNIDSNMDSYIKVINGLYKKFRKAFGERPYFHLGEFCSERTEVVTCVKNVIPAIQSAYRHYECPFSHPEATRISCEEKKSIIKECENVGLSVSVGVSSMKENTDIKKSISLIGADCKEDGFDPYEFGKCIGKLGYHFISGANEKLDSVMGASAKGVVDVGRHSYGVLSFQEYRRWKTDPKALKINTTHLYLVEDNIERIAGFDAASAVILAPGANGTIDEFIELMQRHFKATTSSPIIIYNQNDFYLPLITYLKEKGVERMVKVIDSTAELSEYLMH